MRLGTTEHGSFVWVFGFGTLEFICDLVFGACNFQILQLADILANRNPGPVKMTGR